MRRPLPLSTGPYPASGASGVPASLPPAPEHVERGWGAQGSRIRVVRGVGFRGEGLG